MFEWLLKRNKEERLVNFILPYSFGYNELNFPETIPMRDARGQVEICRVVRARNASYGLDVTVAFQFLSFEDSKYPPLPDLKSPLNKPLTSITVRRA